VILCFREFVVKKAPQNHKNTKNNESINPLIKIARMRKCYFLSTLLFLSFSTFAQQNREPEKLTHWLTPEEALRKNEIGKSFVETNPPSSPVRNVAEFDRMQGALVRYPFGIPVSVIKEMAKNVTLTTIVLNNSQKNTVLQQYVSAGVDTSHCNFLLAPTDSYWTRDYGPWFESDSANRIGIVDFPYNRPRPNDDEIPKLVANMLGIPWFGMNLIHTGGNYMTDGMGISSSSTLVWNENPLLTHEQVAQKMHDYLGIENYLVEPDPNTTTNIDHIDCWGKFLALDKILIRKALPGSPDYSALEATANFYASTPCSYGYNYRVFRVMTPQDQPYSNSVILNNKVLVPIMNSTWDDSAIIAYQNAMPGYEVLGFLAAPSAPWLSTDALHCRVMGIADVGLLYIRHIPISGNRPAENDYFLEADLIACSDSAIFNDSVLVYYKVNNGPYTAVNMINTAGTHYTGIIPKQAGGSTVSYYLYAADKSGRHATAPLIGPADPFRFNTIWTNLTAVPDTLKFLTIQDCLYGKVTQLHNYTAGAITVSYVQQYGTQFPWYVDTMPVLPQTVNPGDSMKLRVSVILPVAPVLNFVIDSMMIITNVDTLKVIIMINDQLMQGIASSGKETAIMLGNNYPNPFKAGTTIPFDILRRDNARLEVWDIRGNSIRTLLDRECETGSQSLVWDGTDNAGNKVPEGIYLYRLTTKGSSVTKRMTLIR
jgi:agmatine deiminase